MGRHLAESSPFSGGHVHLVADRFAPDDRGHAIDVATGERVCLVLSTCGGPSEQTAWAERCAWFSTFVHPSIAQLVDYGAIGESQRFEAWRADPGWPGSPVAAEQTTRCAAQVLRANGRAPFKDHSIAIGCRSGRPVVIPDAAAGRARAADDDSSPECARSLLGVVRRIDRRLVPVLELFGGPSSGRVAALAVWAPEEGGLHAAICWLARAARLAGYIPTAARLFEGPLRQTLCGRTLVILARDDAPGGWRALIEASLDSAKAHIVIFVGSVPVRRVHTVSLERLSIDALIGSVVPTLGRRRQLRHVTAAARRSQGLAGRFERLLLGPLESYRAIASVDEAEGVVRPARSVRVAESLTVYRDAPDAPASDSVSPALRKWPVPGELTRLRTHIETARTLVSKGRYQPGERLARQVMHALARRGEWSAAVESALIIARSLVARGRIGEADMVLQTARPWATQSHDLQLLHLVALIRASVLTERGQVDDAVHLLESLHPSTSSADGDATIEVTLALVRCLFWQGRWADAWLRLTLAAPDGERSRRSDVRLAIARSLVSAGRGRAADAVADAARARDVALTMDEPALRGAAFFACAVAVLAAGDSAQADAAAVNAMTQARRARDPMMVLEVRLLRAEIARRQGRRAVAIQLVKRLRRVRNAVLPYTVRARVDLLDDLLTAADAVAAAERRADSTGLPALRLFAPARAPASGSLASAADEIVELLRCCQCADDDRAVLTTVCARLRGRLAAAGVAFYAPDGTELVALATDGAKTDGGVAKRIAAANQLVLPHHGGERVEAGVPVRYAGHTIGWLIAIWTPAAVWDVSEVSVLLATGATATAPALSGLVARRAGERISRASELIGVSRAIGDVRTAVERAASAPFPVLVEGESGTGKELVARLLHKLGPRADRPFCTLNCAALPEDLVESELFGHAKGAFTGAVTERRGVFEDAHGGTLFLDEIGELSPRAQAKVLRAVQESEIRRVGENIHRRVDVRLVTATNRDLRAQAAAGRFRADLLYRLDVIRVALPPLRERSEDVPILAEHFWRDASGRIGSRAMLSAATLAALARHTWPGNIRELQNVLAALAVRCPRRGVVPPSALPAHFGERGMAASFRLEVARRTFDQSFIRAALVRAGGHRTRAAHDLGISRQGLAKLMTRLQIVDVGDADASADA
jgi:DNA-binding NtrC family response regulator